MIAALVRLLCSHPNRVRERIDTNYARDVLHLVCEDCGHAVPALDRQRVRRGWWRRFFARREVRA